MDFVASVVANEESLVLVQPRERALDDPAVAPEPRAMTEIAVRDLRLDPAVTELAAKRVGVVAAIGSQPLGPSPRPAWSAANRRDRVEEGDQLGDVVAVATAERPREWDPGRVYEKVMLGAVSGSINRARARRGAPFFACT